LSSSAVHNEIARTLRDLGVEVVHEHAQGGLLLPSLAAQRAAARRAHDAQAGIGDGSGHALSVNSPRATASASAAMSPASTRSSPRVATSARTLACARSTPALERIGRS